MGQAGLVDFEEQSGLVIVIERQAVREQVVLTFLLLICAGQIWTIFRGRLTAAIYYCCVAPLGYFSIWRFGTWGPSRLCGLLLVIAGLFVYRRVQDNPRLDRHPFFLFLGYLILITVIGSAFWPYEALVGKSVVYGVLRGVVQIVNWLIMTGAAWQVAIAFSPPGAFEKARETIIRVGVLHSIYALYQVFAYHTGLPVTGIRRAYTGVGGDSMGDQFAAFNIEGVVAYRACSLIGEPKGLGIISLVWIIAIITCYMEGKGSQRLGFALALSIIVLFLTFSTAAWAGLVVTMVIGFWIAVNRSTSRLSYLFAPFLLLAGSFVVLDFAGVLPVSVLSLAKNRTMDRNYGLVDLPEVEAKKVLAANPQMIPFGTGLGGMSFYIAENLGGSNIILSPNTGLLAFVCDMGLIGCVFLVVSFQGGWRPAFMNSARTDMSVLSLSYLGCVCLVQSFIFNAGILTFGLAFLFTAEFRQRHLVASQYA